VKRVALLLAALVGATSLPARADDAADFLSWLEGDWVRETRSGQATETWRRVSDHTLEGIASLHSGDATRVTEHLRLEILGDHVFYLALPAGSDFPTPFRLVAAETDRLVFENPHHDFPQRIVYVREAEDRLLARIEGEEGGEVRGIDFRFGRPAIDDEEAVPDEGMP